MWRGASEQPDSDLENEYVGDHFILPRSLLLSYIIVGLTGQHHLFSGSKEGSTLHPFLCEGKGE
jgi:hypothetical protein